MTNTRRPRRVASPCTFRSVEAMAPRVIPVEPFDLVVFGATGDLAGRKLLPALFYRCAAGQLPAGARIVGVGRRALTTKAFRARARATVVEHVPEADRDDRAVARFIDRI